MAAIPPTSDLNKASMDKDGFHAWLISLHGYLTGLLASSGTAADARAQMGLGSAATKSTGTTDGYVPLVGSDVSVVQPGCVAHFAMSTAPTGWLKANGAAVSRADYAALFTAIGTTFGTGDGSTTFNLPDLRGEFIRGYHDGDTADPDYATRAFGSAQADAFEAHTHGVQTVQNLAGTGSGYNPGGTGVDWPTTSTGGAETRPRNIALLACIKF